MQLVTGYWRALRVDIGWCAMAAPYFASFEVEKFIPFLIFSYSWGQRCWLAGFSACIAWHCARGIRHC